MLYKKTDLPKTLTCILNINNKFDLCHTSFRDLWWFVGGFWGAKILKSEENFENLVRNFNIYSKGHN